MAHNLHLHILVLALILPAFSYAQDAEPSCQLHTVTAEQFGTVKVPGDPFQIILKNGLTYRLSAQPPADRKSHFEKLDPEERVKFYRRRHDLLATAAKALSFPRLAGGVAIVGDKVKACLGRERNSVADRLAAMSAGARGAEVIAHGLEAFDRLIWEDAAVLVKSKMVSFATFLGLGSGLAAANFGYYVNGGVQLDIGYDFETEKRFVQFSWVKQNLQGAIFCFEQMLSLGLLRQYQLQSSIETHTGTAYALPVGVHYRRGETMLASGWVGGLQAADVGSALLAANGELGLASALVIGGRTMSSLSLFWTDTTKEQIFKREFEIAPAKRIRDAWKRWFGKSCEDNLNP